MIKQIKEEKNCLFYKKGNCMSDYNKGIPCNSEDCLYVSLLEQSDSQDKTLDKRKPLVRSNDCSSRTEKDKTDKSPERSSSKELSFRKEPLGDNAIVKAMMIKEAVASCDLDDCTQCGDIEPKPFCLEDRKCILPEYPQDILFHIDDITKALVEVVKELKTFLFKGTFEDVVETLNDHFGKSLMPLDIIMSKDISKKECSDEEADYIKECENGKI